MNGLIFTAKDENDLLRKLKQAIEEPGVMKQRATLLRKKIEENFDRTFVQEQLRKKYEYLLQTVKR